MKTDIEINCISQTVKYDRYMKKFQPKTTCQCRTIDARSLKPIRSDFSLLKILKIFRSKIADQKSKLYRKLKENKLRKTMHFSGIYVQL